MMTHDMKVSFTTLACPDWSWEHIVDRAEEYRYDGIEIRGIADQLDLSKVPAFTPENRETTKSELKKRGLEICCLGSSVRFDTAETYHANIEEGKQWIDLAKAMDVQYIRVFGDTISDPADEKRVQTAIARGLSTLGQYAEATGVKVLIETHGDFTKSTRLAQVFEQVTSNAVGIVWDMHHPWRLQGEPLDETYRLLSPWINHIHMKDSRANHDGTFQYTLTGEGEFPFDEAFQLLQRHTYKGWISFEWEKRWIKELEQPEIALPQFLNYVKGTGRA